MTSAKRPNRRSKSDIEEIAYHEAGHIIVAYLEGLVLDSVDISSRKGNAFHRRESGKDYARAAVVVCFAGLEAQRLYNPNADASRSAADVSEAILISANEGLIGRNSEVRGDAYHHKYLERYRKRARELVNENKTQIKRLANYLAIKRKADRNELYKVLSDIYPQR